VSETKPSALRAGSIDEVTLWYHTLELPGGVTTPGWFDLRAVAERLPWPPVTGKRCLDVGTYDGFYAFELERRGAAEVVATDIPDHADWDLAPAGRDDATTLLARVSGEKGSGFEAAHRALSSKVQRRLISVYDLDPDELGTFDVVVCGSLLLHLRDPVGALEAIRRVCSGWFLSIEQVSLRLSGLGRRRPAAEMSFSSVPTQWWIPNVAGHQRMLQAAGFEVERTVGPFCVPYGVSHPSPGLGPRQALTKLGRLILAGGDGVPHVAALARPRP
jgi:tRNA (mo5U34)-methyltransferase